ncbi:MAG: VWA domain-containing protein [Hyphomonadaceae bacterium]|nr:VWA domain-containing protein [Hyphomonadaceae bacterium]
MHAYILLDRTGSMQSIWDEALGSVNAYVKGLAEGDGYATLAVFDAHDGLQFDVLRAGVPVQTWKDVTTQEASPRGMTPLFDAIGRIIARAESEAPEKAVIVIMTDGEENSSREMKKDDVKAALERCEKKGWQVVFLGAEFAKFNDADAVGIAGGQQVAMSAGRMGRSMAMMARKSRAYFDQGEQMAFDAGDREETGEADVKQRKGS